MSENGTPTYSEMILAARFIVPQDEWAGEPVLVDRIKRFAVLAAERPNRIQASIAIIVEQYRREQLSLKPKAELTIDELLKDPIRLLQSQIDELRSRIELLEIPHVE